MDNNNKETTFPVILFDKSKALPLCEMKINPEWRVHLCKLLECWEPLPPNATRQEVELLKLVTGAMIPRSFLREDKDEYRGNRDEFMSWVAHHEYKNRMEGMEYPNLHPVLKELCEAVRMRDDCRWLSMEHCNFSLQVPERSGIEWTSSLPVSYVIWRVTDAKEVRALPNDTEVTIDCQMGADFFVRVKSSYSGTLEDERVLIGMFGLLREYEAFCMEVLGAYLDTPRWKVKVGHEWIGTDLLLFVEDTEEERGCHGLLRSENFHQLERAEILHRKLQEMECTEGINPKKYRDWDYYDSLWSSVVKKRKKKKLIIKYADPRLVAAVDLVKTWASRNGKQAFTDLQPHH